MRPVSLELQAFGSFAERERVRFDVLAEVGLFVVSGPTGSGKTTIFDAVAMALYGRVPGDRPLDVRSHHASAGVDTEVELVFEVDRRRYRVWRKPAQERAKQRGGGVRQLPAAAELFEWTGEGWLGVASQPSRVTERCTQLVGLDVEQFQRVVLLPQGKFAEFLLSDTGRRQELLRQLFGSSLYLAATEWYVEESKRLHAEVGQVDLVIAHHRANALDHVRDVQRQVPPEHDGTLFSLSDELLGDDATLADIDRALAAALAQVSARQERHRELVAVADGAAREAALAREAAKRFDRATELHAQRAALHDRRDEIDAAAALLAQARHVQPVVVAAERQRIAADALERACRAEQQHAGEVRCGCAALAVAVPRDPVEAAGLLAVRRSELTIQLAQLDAVARAERHVDARAAELQAARQRVQRADAQAGVAAGERAAAAGAVAVLERDAARLDAYEAELTAASAVVERRERVEHLATGLLAAHEAVAASTSGEEQLVRRFAAGVAPRLARELRGGEPCPVCGSRSHPQPARLAGSIEAVSIDDLTAARDDVDRARAVVAGIAAEIAVLERQLGVVAREPIAGLRARLRAATADAHAARGAAAELPGARRRLAAVEEACAAAATAVAGAHAHLAAATARHDAAAAELAHRRDGLDGIGEADVRAAGVALDLLDVAVTAWAGSTVRLDRAVAEAGRCGEQLAVALAASGCADVPSALALGRCDDELDRLERSVASWQHELAGVEQRLAEVVAQGVPARRPDVDALAEASRAAGLDAAAQGAVLARVEQRCHDARASLDRAAADEVATAARRAELAVAREVMLTCTGQLGARTMFETWVLAAELDRVTEAATVHLHRMSAGRYTLRRGDTAAVAVGSRKTGLDLVVFDAHTGRERVPATLSGGERFQASLALALGLADVVSQGGTGSGRVFEALFVDEGFGSLDPDALDDAIEALQHLQAHGRMVGVITHVEAMKQQLQTGIEVRVREDGRGSTVVQSLVGQSPVGQSLVGGVR